MLACSGAFIGWRGGKLFCTPPSHPVRRLKPLRYISYRSSSIHSLPLCRVTFIPAPFVASEQQSSPFTRSVYTRLQRLLIRLGFLCRSTDITRLSSAKYASVSSNASSDSDFSLSESHIYSVRFEAQKHNTHGGRGVRLVSGSNSALPKYSDEAHRVETLLVCTLAFLVYDVLLTLGDEVELIWPCVSIRSADCCLLISLPCMYRKPMRTWVKWQFLLTRYTSLAAQA